MHDCARPIFFQYGAQLLPIRNIAFLERPPFDRPNVTARKVVVRDRYVALCGQRFASVAADIARAASHENVQSICSAVSNEDCQGSTTNFA